MAVKTRRPRIGKPKLRVVFPKENGRRSPDLTPADREYIHQLHQLVDRIYVEAANKFEWTWSQLAVNAGLTYQTVANLGERKTKWPRFSTVWRLCRAVGWDLAIKKIGGDKKTVILRRKAS